MALSFCMRLTLSFSISYLFRIGCNHVLSRSLSLCRFNLIIAELAEVLNLVSIHVQHNSIRKIMCHCTFLRIDRNELSVQYGLGCHFPFGSAH